MVAFICFLLCIELQVCAPPVIVPQRAARLDFRATTCGSLWRSDVTSRAVYPGKVHFPQVRLQCSLVSSLEMIS